MRRLLLIAVLLLAGCAADQRAAWALVDRGLEELRVEWRAYRAETVPATGFTPERLDARAAGMEAGFAGLLEAAHVGAGEEEKP